MKKTYFPKRIPEPKKMDKIEMKSFEKATKENYQRWIIPLVDDVLQKANLKKGVLLDVACGPGLLVKEFAKRSKSFAVFGVDASSDAMRIARENCKGMKNTSFIKANAYHLPFKDSIFDLVVCKDSLHHFNNSQKALKEMMRVVKMGGLIYIQDLRRDLPWYLLKTAIPPDTVFKKLQFYSARASYTKQEIKKILDELHIQSYTVQTRNITKKLAQCYKKKGITYVQLKAGFQSRYVAIVKKKKA